MAKYRLTRMNSPRAKSNFRRGLSVRTTISSCIPLLRALARTRTRNDADADDLVADTLAEAVIHKSELTPATNRKAWLLALQRGVFNANGRAEAPSAPTQQSSYGVETTRQCLREALLQLPDALREPLFLFDGVGCGIKEVAEILCCTTVAADARIGEGRSRLRGLLDGRTG
jgi:DNA-directed RNA polymerase specialized sigma24 family protein